MKSHCRGISKGLGTSEIILYSFDDWLRIGLQKCRFPKTTLDLIRRGFAWRGKTWDLFISPLYTDLLRTMQTAPTKWNVVGHLTSSDGAPAQPAITILPHWCTWAQTPRCHQDGTKLLRSRAATLVIKSRGATDPAFSCNCTLLPEEAFKHVPLPVADKSDSWQGLSTVLTWKLTNWPWYVMTEGGV